MRGRKRILFISCAFTVCFSLAGCKQGFAPIYDVAEDLQIHVDAFLEEGATRGHELSINNLIVEYDPELAFPTCGLCNSHSTSNDIQKVVTINPNCTMTYNEQMECLLFHELGHCVLGREHDSDLLPNGDLKSIMTPRNVDLYAPCIYQIGEENCDFTFKRGYYLDELFDQTTAVPEWAK